jgi:hypothetical protein
MIKEILNATYSEGSELLFQLIFNEDIVVQGNPQLELNIGGYKRYAEYFSGSDTSVLQFRYIVDIKDSDTNGIEVNSHLYDNGADLSNK